MNYDQWLRSQSKKFQDDALGFVQAEAFRNGKVVKRFVEHGKPLTLDELNKTNDISINGE